MRRAAAGLARRGGLGRSSRAPVAAAARFLAPEFWILATAARAPSWRAFASTTVTNGADASAKGESVPDDQVTSQNPRLAILDAALGKVQEYGWTDAALAAGAVECGLPTVSVGMLPRGAMDLVDHFMASALAETRRKMAEETAAAERAEGKGEGAGKDGVSEERITRAMETRLTCLAPYVKSWPQAMALGLLPKNVPATAKAIAAVADELAFLGGDRSTDPSAWYGRRAALAAAYVSAELYMLTDTSPSFSDTRAYVRRAVRDFGCVVRSPGNAQDFLFGATTAATALASAGMALLTPALKQAPGAATAAQMAPAAAAVFQAVLAYLASKMPPGPATGDEAPQQPFAAAPEVDPWMGDAAFEAHLKKEEEAFRPPAAGGGSPYAA